MADPSKKEATTPGPSTHISRIDAESRVDEVIEKAQSLNTEETQLLVDCLSLSLDKNAAPLKTRAYVWRSLIKIASSAKIFAQNHTLDAGHISPGNDSASSGVYEISGDGPARVKVMKRTNNTDELYAETLMSWAHLSHPNILPLYAVFLEDKHHPCLVSPYTTDQTICDYIRDNSDISRMLLVSDVVNGLSYMHQRDIVHGGLYPESVLISRDGRAVITDLNPADLPPVRYSAPELLADDEIQPTKAIDMWALACLCYEVLSGRVPFCHITKDLKIAVAITAGSQPNRPGHGGIDGNEIGDAIWQILLMCWEIKPAGRPACLTVQQIFLGMDIQDIRPAEIPTVLPGVINGSTIDFDYAQRCLAPVFGSDHSPSLRVPEHLRNTLFSFIPDAAKLNATAAAAKKLSPDDTQMFVDFLDLMIEDLIPDDQRATKTLLSSISMSTHVIPCRYRLNGMQYDPTPIYDGPYAKAYKGRGVSVRVNTPTPSWLVKGTLALLPDWFHTSDPNVFPFYGVFHEGAGESPRLCVVTSFWENGFLEDYAPTLPQKSRLPLISDIASGMAYLVSHGIGFSYPDEGNVMISDEGRAVLAFFNSNHLLAKKVVSLNHSLRFGAPRATECYEDKIWIFGCVCYMVLIHLLSLIWRILTNILKVLSRKEPYYQYTEDEHIRSALSRGEPLKRPDRTDGDLDEIDDQAWDLITKCCSIERGGRPTATEAQELVASWEIEDSRPPAKPPAENVLTMRSRPNVNFSVVEALLGKIQVELLRSPLSTLLQSHIKDVTRAATELKPEDIRTLVDFLDLALKDHLSISEEQSRVLALLSRITSSTHIFPQRHELKGIKYHPRPMAEGGYGTVHRGTDIDVCVKVMTQVDPKALTPWIRELILWAHASHSNILPFCGVLLENVNNSQRIYLVSPFMKNGNLRDYAPRLSQKSRLPLILDIIKGLGYLHGLGIIHSDLKGENVLISNEGRALITDFGSTQITTATVTLSASVVPTTLRFAAPEAVLSSGSPTKEADIWSFGCLCYEVLSQQVPYYQYSRDIQISAALARKELPRRPGTIDPNTASKTSDDDWDDDEEEDWDEIDDQAWNLITRCCAPEPEDRLKPMAIEELIVDMKVWDDRPAAKAVVGTEISKLRANPEIDLNRVGELLDKLQKMVVPAGEANALSFSELFNSLLD
ncbi:hypothetical protein D9756_002615 [Leucocoprinus leucothites]|uniref:Protein kinase domain-containing protein n=1 Tax=Leucocoprinus leucothites TaxID=201217 RepID=A0A8H5LLP1_9AGAR|nr:hypothetical protein D9756_002615 [Leucoagaricus leucothites]